MFKQLQEDHKAWALKNFGEQDVEDYALGLIEEVGELAHSVLKRKQGIRNTEDHDLKIRDAIGDITIYLVGFCTGHNKELVHSYMDLFKGRGDSLTECLILISVNVDRVVISKADFPTIIELIESLMQFCFSEGIDYRQTVKETWENVVSKRDWKANPDCSMINLCDNCIHSDKPCAFDSGNNEVVVSNCESHKNLIVKSGIEILLENSDLILLAKEE